MVSFQVVAVAFSLVLSAESRKFGCDFDKDHMCKFKNINYEWDIRKGDTPSVNTGPDYDVSGKGYYVYMEASSRFRGEKAKLVSESIRESFLCLRFSYHMYGSGMGTLNIYVRKDSDNSKTNIFSLSGDQSDQWYSKEITLSEHGKYKVIFEAVRGSSFRSDIALDDIWFTSGACSSPTTSQPSTTLSTSPVTTEGSTVKPSGSCGQKGYGLSSFPKIVGGQEATPGEWPWQVALLKRNFQFCGGSLISRNHVLTAAHCLKASEWPNVKIRIGEHDLSKTEGYESDVSIAPNGIFIHSKYDDASSDYDIAVVKLASPVTFSSRVKPVCTNSGIDMTGKKCFISGWGRLTDGGMASDVLQEAQVPIITNDKCREAYGASAITDRMICAGYSSGGTDTCQGDSGGPLVCEHSDGSWHLTGITSWGMGCALKGYYGVYTKVTHLISWVNGIVQS